MSERAHWRAKGGRPLSFSRGFGWSVRTDGTLDRPLGGAKSEIVCARPTVKESVSGVAAEVASGGVSISAGTPTTGRTGGTSRTRASARSGAAKPHFRLRGRHQPGGSCHLCGGDDQLRHHRHRPRGTCGQAPGERRRRRAGETSRMPGTATRVIADSLGRRSALRARRAWRWVT